MMQIEAAPPDEEKQNGVQNKPPKAIPDATENCNVDTLLNSPPALKLQRSVGLLQGPRKMPLPLIYLDIA